MTLLKVSEIKDDYDFKEGNTIFFGEKLFELQLQEMRLCFFIGKS